MATHNSLQGIIKVGTDTLGELKSFSFSETSNLSSTAATFAAGKTSFAGSAEAFWDNDDAAQNALSIGSVVTMHFYPEGFATGDKFRSGSCVISEISTSISMDGMVEASFSFTGSGVLAEATVS